MTHPPVIIVDEQDNVVGSADLRDVWQNGQIHRIVRIMVEDPDGRMLLQKRSQHVRLFPGCWDPSAGGHVDEGESYEEAAERELREELGISGISLTEMGYYRSDNTVEGRRLNRFNKLYRAIIPPKTNVTFDTYEVTEVRWFAAEEIKQLIAEHPELISDGLQDTIEKYY